MFNQRGLDWKRVGKIRRYGGWFLSGEVWMGKGKIPDRKGGGLNRERGGLDGEG